MLYFLLFTLIAWIATACMTKILFFSISQGQWIDKLFNYQAWLQRLDEKGYSIVKPLGLCEMCFSHLIAFISYAIYLLVMVYGLEMWVSDYFTLGWVANVVWYFVYVPISSMLNLYFITQLFK